MKKYCIVAWHNDRKKSSAWYLTGFDDFEMAKKYAYKRAEQDDNIEDIITESPYSPQQNPQDNPYYGKIIIGYGGRDHTGSSTRFFCVVPWYSGIERRILRRQNEDGSWDNFGDDEYWNN